MPTPQMKNPLDVSREVILSDVKGIKTFKDEMNFYAWAVAVVVYALIYIGDCIRNLDEGVRHNG